MNLHEELRSFYNSSHDYFEEAGETNEELTPERKHLFSFIKPGDTVIDIGCGTCENSRHLTHASYHGCDISFLALNLAAKKTGKVFPRVQAESQALPFSDNSFAVVMSTYALEHFVYPMESLQEMYRICKKGGRLILVSPAYDDPRLLPPSTTHWSSMDRARLIFNQTLRQVSRHISPHRYFFSRVEKPRVLAEKYQSDFDAVHLVSAREISNFFLHQGGKIIFERKRAARPIARGTGLGQQIKESLRNMMLGLHLFEYSGLNLQIVVEKT